MKKLAKYLLLTLLVVLLAGWLLLTLFDANRLKQPVLAWLNEHTELDASIGDITFNPLHPYTLLAQDVREALRYLGNITGAIEPDRDILGTIFGKFCIGK